MIRGQEVQCAVQLVAYISCNIKIILSSDKYNSKTRTRLYPVHHNSHVYMEPFIPCLIGLTGRNHSIGTNDPILIEIVFGLKKVV